MSNALGLLARIRLAFFADIWPSFSSSLSSSPPRPHFRKLDMGSVYKIWYYRNEKRTVT